MKNGIMRIENHVKTKWTSKRQGQKLENVMVTQCVRSMNKMTGW
ncbi:hypothetical protein GCM10025794_31750 [Massilia kyonggiensis]